MRIFLNDDDPLLRRALRRALDAHLVEEAQSGAEVLERLAQDSAYDAILCDVMMPEMSGLEVLAALRVRHPALVPHLAFVTGSLNLSQTQTLLRRSTRPCVEKPVARAGLLALVERLGAGVPDA